LVKFMKISFLSLLALDCLLSSFCGIRNMVQLFDY
jgi:hypothetical protein